FLGCRRPALHFHIHRIEAQPDQFGTIALSPGPQSRNVILGRWASIPPSPMQVSRDRGPIIGRDKSDMHLCQWFFGADIERHRETAQRICRPLLDRKRLELLLYLCKSFLTRQRVPVPFGVGCQNPRQSCIRRTLMKLIESFKYPRVLSLSMTQ